jgi:PPOX class probable F420-dependent enzyme
VGLRLNAEQLELLGSARRAVLATIAADGRPRLVPCAYAIAEPAGGGLFVYSALDDKPKSVADPRDLARVRDITARPRVSLLVDRWDEDWSRLAWLRLEGMASLLEPTDRTAAEHPNAVGLLRARYPQYAAHNLEARPIIRVSVEHVTGWPS